MRDPTYAVTLTGDHYTWVTSMLPQPDGQILVGGKFLGVDGDPVKHLVRLNGEHVPVLRALGPPRPAGFPMELVGEPGRGYWFELSSNLVDWSVVGELTNSLSGTSRFTNAPERFLRPHFYRARRM